VLSLIENAELPTVVAEVNLTYVLLVPETETDDPEVPAVPDCPEDPVCPEDPLAPEVPEVPLDACTNTSHPVLTEGLFEPVA